jgi:hypothetical protein
MAKINMSSHIGKRCATRKDLLWETKGLAGSFLENSSHSRSNYFCSDQPQLVEPFFVKTEDFPRFLDRSEDVSVLLKLLD